MASRCHHGQCSSCSLCKKSNARYTHPITMKEKQREGYTLLKNFKPDIGDTECICAPCAKQLSRNVSNPNFHPRWLPKPNESGNKCNIENCEHPVYSRTNLVTVDRLQEMLDERVIAFDVEPGQEVSIGLCTDHYLRMYRQLHQPHPCASCGGKPRKGEQFTRHCPAPAVITNYLNHISSETVDLKDTSIICLSCYKYFHWIIKQLQQENSKAQQNQTSFQDIESVISRMSERIQTIQSKDPENISVNEYADMSMCQIGIQVAHAMSKDEALLLPNLYRDFVSKVRDPSHAYPVLTVTENDVPTTRWLLSRLHHYFGDMLQVECKHKRHGSLLLHKNCDLLKALSSALGKKKSLQTSDSSEASSSTEDKPPSIEEQRNNVANDINNRLHNQSKALVTSFQNSPERYATLKTDILYEMLDPVLLKFVQQATQSTRARKRKLFQSSHEIAHTRQIRQLYALCVLMFNTNSQCSMPFHTLLTEAILCHGGSLEQVRVFNRVGAAASIDTNSRLATLVVQERIMKGIVPDLIPRTLTIVSIDNNDILQPHVLVSCTDATRSWHGTSVQCVQPLPISSYLTEEEQVRPRPSRKHPVSSPVASPMPVEKRKCRRRTLTEQPSPHTSIALPQEQQLDEINIAEYRTSLPPRVSIEQFRPTLIERQSLSLLEEDIFRCMLLKYAKPLTDKHLPGIPSLLNCIRHQTSDREVGKVVYVEILSERAHTKVTLNKVLGQLYNTFVVQYGQKWVIVVGDAKTYDLLQSIRFEYGSHLKWLIPMPGDWHILFNYQKVLMKAYADAGLVQLAGASGHRAETLTSLIQCSNFRRTHNFLLQTFEALYRVFVSWYIFRCGEAESDYQGEIKSLLLTLIAELTEVSADEELQRFRSKVDERFSREL